MWKEAITAERYEAIRKGYSIERIDGALRRYIGRRVQLGDPLSLHSYSWEIEVDPDQFAEAAKAEKLSGIFVQK